MITAAFEVTPAFNAGIAGLIHKVGLKARDVVSKESGELMKALVRVSPPKEPARTRYQIETAVQGKMDMATTGGNRRFEETDGEIGATGIKWYSVTEEYLRGVLPERDMRKDSVDTVYRTFRRMTKGGRMVFQFKKPRDRQKVMISQRILVTKQQRKAITKRIQSHVGRLKAGWLVAVRDGVIRLSGGRMPPQWVTRHLLKGVPKGTYQNGLGVPQHPTFTIINQAKGIGNPKHNLTFFINLALKARAAAMQTQIRLLFSGKKPLSSYAR